MTDNRNARAAIEAVWPEAFSHIVATIRDFDKIVALKDQAVTGHTIAHFLHDRFAPTLGYMGPDFWRAVAEVADAEIWEFSTEPVSLARIFMQYDRYILGGRA